MPIYESHKSLRILDANLNRSSEGLRVLEDIARFSLNEAELSQKLRAIRHNLGQGSKSLSIKLLSQRDSEHDVGVNRAKQPQQDLADVIRANAKRVEESLRVMEEFAKLPQMRSVLDSAKLEQARFTLYTLERELISRVLRHDKTKQLTGLYLILDRQVLAGRADTETASQAIAGGASAIQLRDKQGNKRELLPIAQKLKDLCTKADILFIINDYLDLALATDADGLHIGQKDLPLPIIRRELPIDKIVGCSVNTSSQAIMAQEEGADYISVGSIFPTTTKSGAIVVGIDRIREVKEVVSLPLVAIGGINEDNINQVIAAGADAAAVASAVLCQENIKGGTQRLIARMNFTEEKCQNR
jgi:thiamine-phosphate pyrophosphorylase